MKACLTVLTFSLIAGFIGAVPFNEDFMHHLTPPRPIPSLQLEPFQLQAQELSGLPHLWQNSANNPFPVYSSFDRDAEFFPLVHAQQRTQGPHLAENPFGVDVVTSEVGSETSPGVFIQQSFPFFGNDFFNSFGGFGFGAGPQQEPWWKGPNVCTEKEDNDEKMNSKDNIEKLEDTEAEPSETLEVRPPLFGTFHISVDSCIEKPNKHVCTKIVNQNGKKKTLTITRQCCHGYGRPRNAHVATPCEKIEIKSIEDTAADMGAKMFIASAKNNDISDMIAKLKNVTIFMPLDDPFSRFNEQMLSEKNMVESKSDDSMRDMFMRHIVSNDVSLDDVNNEQVFQTQLAGQSVRINAYQMPDVLSTEPLQYTANCVPVEKHDQLIEQGLVHTLRGVMKPVTMRAMDIIRERPDMSIMRTVLENTKLSKLLEGEKPVTIFVPNDAAFDKLEPHLRRALKEGKGCAANILKNHILDLTFCSAASISGAKTTVYNILGEAMRFNRNSTSSTVKSEVSDSVKSQPILINGIAKIIDADLMGTNGVVHVIDTILPTDSALPLTTLMQEQNVILFKRLLEAAGVDNKFDDMDNITLFAPTDKAIQSTKWAQILSESPEKLLNNQELLEVINYHVVSPMTKTCDLTENLLPTAAGPSVRINLYSTHALFSNVMNRATVNCARLVHFDNESCGSVLHQVDKVLTPPKKNLLQILESEPNYAKFVELVKSANLTKLLNDAEESYTVLVPKNDVFEEVEDWEKTFTKDQTELVDLVKTHIVNDVVCCAGIIPTNWPFVRSIEALNGAHLHITRNRRPRIENAGVTKCDGIASNGIIHEINDVIVPKSRQQGQQHATQKHPIENFGGIFF